MIGAAFLVKNPPLDRMAMLCEYLLPTVSEFVIVDTGSPKQVRDIVRGWPFPNIKVLEPSEKEYTHFGRFDFAKARNIGVREITRPWTLIVDPDELPSREMMVFLENVTLGIEPPKDALGWLFWTVNYWGGVRGPAEEYHWHCRLFRTGHGEFYRRVHELVMLDHMDEAQTRNTPILPRAPQEAYLIHSKAADAIARDDELYAKLGGISK